MLTTDDLRSLLVEDERHCPDLAVVRHAVSAPERSGRRRTGALVASAAAVAAVTIVTTVAVAMGGSGPAPTVRPGLPTVAGSTESDASAAEFAAAERAAIEERAAKAAARSAANSAASAASTAAASQGLAEACSARVQGVPITAGGSATGSVDAEAVRQLALACATIFGASGKPTVEWVDTTLVGLGVATGVTASPRPKTRVIVAQVTGVFEPPFGDQDRPISMLLILDPAGQLPGGAQIPVTGSNGGPVDLSLAGTVHR